MPARDIATFSQAEITQKVRVERSDFDPSEVYVNDVSIQPVMFTSFFLRSFVPKNGGLITHQMYFRRVYDSSGWIFYTRASDDEAVDRKVVSIVREVVSCSGTLGTCIHEEQVSIELPDDVLRRRAATGVRVRVSSQNGSGAMVLALPANYIQGHLAALPR